MSLRQNEEWLEAAKETFETALAEQNWDLAKDVVDDMFWYGFKKEGVECGQKLLAEKLKVRE